MREEVVQARDAAVDRLLEEEVKPPLGAAAGRLDVQVGRVGDERHVEGAVVDLLPRVQLRDAQVVALRPRPLRSATTSWEKWPLDQPRVPLADRAEPDHEDPQAHQLFQVLLVTVPVAGSSTHTVLVPYEFAAATPTALRAPRGNVSSSRT